MGCLCLVELGNNSTKNRLDFVIDTGYVAF